MRRYFFIPSLNRTLHVNIYSVGLAITFAFVLSACTLATVRSIDEDEEAKAGFDPVVYVDGLWEEQLVATITENAIDINELLTQIDANEAAATEEYGARSGTGAFSFMVKGEAQVLEVNLESRIGLMALDFAPYDGTADANMAIGPVIRNRNNSVRDAVGFIQFNDFVNQTEFAGVSTAIKDRILQTVIEPLDLESLPGKTVSFYGAFTLDNRDDIEIVPISVEVSS